MIQQAFDNFKARFLKKDPQADVNLYQTPVRQVIDQTKGGQPLEAVADLHISSKGVEYRYCLVRDVFTGAFSTIPFVNVVEK